MKTPPELDKIADVCLNYAAKLVNVIRRRTRFEVFA